MKKECKHQTPRLINLLHRFTTPKGEFSFLKTQFTQFLYSKYRSTSEFGLVLLPSLAVKSYPSSATTGDSFYPYATRFA
jgi:hypothetical protein